MAEALHIPANGRYAPGVPEDVAQPDHAPSEYSLPARVDGLAAINDYSATITVWV